MAAKKAQNKTVETDASVAAYLAAIEPAQRRDDCTAIVDLMRKVTGHEPRMWGTSIVGFDSYTYRYDSGREGESCVVGLSSRKAAITLYVGAGSDSQQPLLARLGTHTTGKGCLYLKRLADVDATVLEQIVANGVAEVRAQYP